MDLFQATQENAFQTVHTLGKQFVCRQLCGLPGDVTVANR
jgi:hypothetical protein